MALPSRPLMLSSQMSPLLGVFVPTLLGTHHETNKVWTERDTRPVDKAS